MATFEITAPDGKTYEVEGATQEGAVAALKKMLGQSQSEDRSKWGVMGNVNNVMNQIGTGMFKGLAVFPGMAGDLAKADTPKVSQTGNPKIDAIKASLEEGRQTSGNVLPTGQDILRYLEMIPGLDLAPAETRGDKLLQAGGAGATGAFMPGGALPNFVGGVTGSVASEGAGQLTEGTALEPYARIGAGLIGGLAGSYGVNKLAASNAEQLINKATQQITPDDWNAAMALQSEAARRGTPITSAEALAQVTGGNRTLQSIQRTIEQSPDASGTMDKFMAARPEGNAAALQGQLDDLAPKSGQPFEVGPTVQKAAQQAVETVRKQINALTDDAYRWGTDQLIPPAEFAPVAENPIFQHFASKVRSDPILGPAVADLDENSVAFVNAVKKEMGEAADSFTSFTSQSKSPERAMRVEQAQTPMVDAAKKSSPLYDEALTEQARMRQTQLEPLKRGPVGQLAETSDWKAQAKIIMSDAPGSEKQVAEAVRTVSQNAPEAVPELLRMKIEDVFNKSLPNAKGSMEQFRGANLAGKLGANPQAMASLEAAVKALPNGETQWVGLRRLLDVFEAQGQRLPAGSPTSFNQQLAGDLQKNLGRGLKSFGTDLWANWNIQRRSQELARILTAPEGVALLRQLAVTGPNTARAQQLVQGFYQGAQATKPIEIRVPSLQQAR